MKAHEVKTDHELFELLDFVEEAVKNISVHKDTLSEDNCLQRAKRTAEEILKFCNYKLGIDQRSESYSVDTKKASQYLLLVSIQKTLNEMFPENLGRKKSKTQAVDQGKTIPVKLRCGCVRQAKTLETADWLKREGVCLKHKENK